MNQMNKTKHKTKQILYYILSLLFHILGSWSTNGKKWRRFAFNEIEIMKWQKQIFEKDLHRLRPMTLGHVTKIKKISNRRRVNKWKIFLFSSQWINYISFAIRWLWNIASRENMSPVRAKRIVSIHKCNMWIKWYWFSHTENKVISFDGPSQNYNSYFY